MNTIKARIYGNGNRCGVIKRFEIIDELPIEGEEVTFGDPDFIWGKAKEAHLDPEQRTGDDDRLADYDFYIVPEIDAEDGEDADTHFFAIER